MQIRSPGRPTVVAIAACLLVVAACNSTTAPATTSPVSPVPSGSAPSLAPVVRQTPSSSKSAPTAKPQASSATGPRAVVVAARLPVGLSRAGAAVLGGELYVIGGLTASGTTSDAVGVMNPDTSVAVVGHLVHPVHDAAVASIGSVILVFGGGATSVDASIQAVDGSGTTRLVGALPAPRADFGAAATAAGVVIAGGQSNGLPDPAVLITTDGVSPHILGALPVAVRYGAVAAVGRYVYVIGGTAASGDTAAVQRIDSATGSVKVVATFPMTLSHASAATIKGQLLVFGGRHGGVAQNGIWAFDHTTERFARVGSLPYAVSDAAATVFGNVAYLVGGEATGSLATTIAISLP